MEEAPLARLTPKIDVEEDIITKTEEHKLNYEKINYILSLSLSESNKIIFKMSEVNAFTPYHYISIDNLDTLSKIDKQFRAYDTIKEVFDFLSDILKNNQVLIEKSDEKFNLKFSFPLGNKIKEIRIPLKARAFVQKNINEETVKKVDDLEAKLNIEIQENKKMVKNINDLETKLNKEIQEKINNK